MSLSTMETGTHRKCIDRINESCAYVRANKEKDGDNINLVSSCCV